MLHADIMRQVEHMKALSLLCDANRDTLLGRQLFFMCPISAPDKWEKKWKLGVLGGKRHLAESSKQCAIREAREEAGIELGDWLGNHQSGEEEGI